MVETTPSRRFQNLFQAFPMFSLFKLLIAAVILAFNSSLVLRKVSLVVCSTALYKGTPILEVRRPDVRGDMIAEVFSQPTLASRACESWHKVLLPDVKYSSSHPLDPGLHYISQALNESFHVEYKAVWEDEWRQNDTIAS